MKKIACLFVCLVFLFAGCGGKDNIVEISPSTNFKYTKMSAEDYTQKVDTFVVILDASDSMEEVYMEGSEERKIDTAMKFLHSMFNTIPDLEFTAGFRVFGMPKIPHSDDTPILYWLTDTDRSGLLDSLKGVKTGRNYYSSLALSLNRTANNLLTVDSRPAPGDKTLAHRGVDATDKMFKAPRGKIAVIVVGDGNDNPDAAQLAGDMMKKRFGDRLNLYTVVVGNELSGRQSLEALARSGGGFAVASNDLTAASSMQGFVEKILVAPDEDNDGVADSSDQCPGTPAGVMANMDGCTPDTDRDGVYDYLDRCPRTPYGLAVNAMGCPADTDADGKYDDQDQSPTTPEWVNDLKWGSVSPAVRYLRYDVNAHALRPWMYAMLDEYVAYLNINTGKTLHVRGFTDDVGGKSANLGLSKKRANAVRDYLLKSGIDASRLSVSYHGIEMPMADPNTIEGRNLNRRVELEIMD